MRKPVRKPAAKSAPSKPANPKPAPTPVLADPTEDDIDTDAFATLVAGGAGGTFLAAEVLRPLKHFGYATADMTKSDPEGNIACWITPAGQTYFDENYDTSDTDVGGAEGAAATTATDGGFVIRTDVPLPSGKRGYSDRGTKYPFDTMPVGASFHIPKTDDRPKPSATFASTVTSANKRFAAAVAEGQTPRKFKCASVGPDDPDGIGARIYRIQ